MNEKIAEALGILQEECAEVIQEVSKIRRFGIDTISHKSGVSHATMLEMELGDVLCLIDYLVDNDIVDQEGLMQAKRNKQLKLEKWSKIYVKN